MLLSNFRITASVLTVASLAMLTACALPQGTTESGFIGDYSGMEPGRAGQGERFVADVPEPGSLKPFTSVAIEPVAFFGPGFTTTLMETDRQLIASIVEARLNNRLAPRFRIVASGTKDASTLRLRVALTDLKRANPTINALTAGVLGVATKPSVLRAEVEILDSLNGDRVAALTWAGTGGAFEGRNALLDAKANGVLAKQADEFASAVAELLTER